jgi:glycosyltransferase involved in cell wall biosynthesis
MVAWTPVTLLLPVRNGDKFLVSCLDQIEKMAREGDEILVLNDGSTDKTLEILESWKISKCDFRVISTKGVGLVEVLNIGIFESKRDWIARVDVDDFYDQERLRIQTALIQDNVVAVFSDYKIVSASNKSLGKVPSALTHTIVKLSLVSGNRTAHPIVLFKKQTALMVGGYALHEYPAEDLGLWMRMSNHGKLVSSSKNLLRYRLNPKSITLSNQGNSTSTREFLAKQFNFNADELSKLGFEIDLAISIYKREQATYRRIFLLYWDLFRYRRLHPSQIPVKLFINRNTMSIVFILAGTRLACEKLVRLIYRKLIC